MGSKAFPSNQDALARLVQLPGQPVDGFDGDLPLLLPVVPAPTRHALYRSQSDLGEGATPYCRHRPRPLDAYHDAVFRRGRFLQYPNEVLRVATLMSDPPIQIRRGWHPGTASKMAGHPDQVVRVFCLRAHKLLLLSGLPLVLD
jgi:hypothetical protein